MKIKILLVLSFLTSFYISTTYASIFSVTVATDGGVGSLRDHIANSAVGDTITFDASTNGAQITLTTGDIDITKSLTIIGNGENNTIIDGNNNSRIFEILSAGTVEINSLTIKNGLATGVGNAALGGGIFLIGTTLTINDVTVKENNSDDGGGFFFLTGTCFVNNCTIAGNQSNGGGGGILLLNSTVTLVNALIAGNVANNGGGIFNQASTLSLINATVSGNFAAISNGGGVDGGFTATNSVIWGNIAASPATNEVNGVVAGTYTLIKDQNLTGTGNLDGTLAVNNPLFVSPITATSTPSTSGDYRVNRCLSPLIDVGDNTANTSTMTIGGNNRIVDGDNNTTAIIDIGAHENPLLLTTIVVLNTNDTGLGSLRQTVLDACVGDTITFDPSTNGVPIVLTGMDIDIMNPLTIIGNGSDSTIIDGNANARVFNINNAGKVSINQLTIKNGMASGVGNAGNGGGVFSDTTDITLNGVAIKENNSDSTGGGVELRNGIVSIMNCAISGNKAISSGGGVLLDNATTTITNTLIAGNVVDNGLATATGGGIFGNGTGMLTLINTTVADNFADGAGGGVIGNFTGVNSVIWGNLPGETNGLFSVTYTLIKGQNPPGMGNLNGVGMNDPLFAAPIIASNTPTIVGDYRLQCGSPLIDVGNDLANTTSSALDGNNRILDGDLNSTATIDIGAYEFLFSPPTALFTATPKSSCTAPSTVTFTDQSISSVGWQWDFGDGNFSTLPNPSNTYTTQDTFIVILIVTNSLNCKDTVQDTIFTLDVTPPTITCPNNDTILADPSCQIILPDYTSLAVTSDVCDPSPTITQNPMAGTTVSGNTTVWLLSTDVTGNVDSCSFMVLAADTVVPSISCPISQIAATNITCDVILADYTSMATTTDVCDPNPTVTQLPLPGMTISTDTTVWLYSTDASGNVDSCSFMLAIADSMPPSIACLTTQLAIVDNNCDVVLTDYTTIASTTDNCDANPVFTQLPIAGTVLTVDTTVWLFSVDVSGNIDSCSFQVLITDTTAPIVTCLPDQMEMLDENCEFMLPDYTQSILTSDNCNANLISTQLPPTGTMYSDTQDVSVTVTFEDTTGNMSACTFNVSIEVNPLNPDCKDELLVSTMLTPNGDGKNDTWIIREPDLIKGCTVMVFNRWGQKVFESTAYNNEWGGTSSGQPLPDGNYYYTITCNDNTEHKGPLTILRTK